MTLLFLVLAILGWSATALCVVLIVFLSVAFAAQEARFAEQINDLKKSQDGAILLKSRRNQNK